MITLNALDVARIESRKVTKSVKQYGLYMVLELAKVIMWKEARATEKIQRVRLVTKDSLEISSSRGSYQVVSSKQGKSWMINGTN